MAIRVAVDAMGGDKAPSVVIEGAREAIRQSEDDLHILLFGPEDRLREEMASHDDLSDLPIQIVDAPEVIGMAESPTAAVKGKPHSSIHLGLGAHKARHADAFVSAGNTGAVMAASLFILGRLPNVLRPTVLGYFPTEKGHCILLDAGTNVDCKPEHLVQFAQMGSLYMERVMGRENPVVGLLNVGEEQGKGDERAKTAYTLLKAEPSLNFRGNIEGRDILHHAADVIISDGFVGNVMLKFGESVATALPQMIGREMHRLNMPPQEQSIVAKALRGVQARFNYEEYGGAPLLGVNGNVIIGHGGSSARAFRKMFLVAVEEVKQDIAGGIAAALKV